MNAFLIYIIQLDQIKASINFVVYPNPIRKHFFHYSFNILFYLINNLMWRQIRFSFFELSTWLGSVGDRAGALTYRLNNINTVLA